jgi:2-polyprenyl-3-methyl-5-hydroxy-6-metoxy-1,4-benzoquinol methylase
MKCLVCGNEKKFTKLYPKFCQVKNILCKNCGLVFISKQESLKEYYKKDGYYKESPNRGLRREVISRNLLIALGRKRLEVIKSSIDIDFNNKKVLDVGCGYGHLLYCIKEEFGAKVYGLEPSSQVVNIGKEFFNVDIIKDVLENYNTKEKFDIVMCNHTIEHTDNPELVIKELGKHLTTDGLLYIEVPNILKPTGNTPLNNFLYHEHLYNFSTYNLELLLNKCGFEVLQYNDDKFIMILCKASTNPKKKTKKIESKHIIESLKEYKRNYGYIDLFKVYFNKFLYLLKALRCKFL